MKKSLSFFLLVSCFSVHTLLAQVQLPMNPQVQAAIRKNTRTTNGKPGKAYWQNTADYKIRVNFEPATRQLSGTVNISYKNNSPDTLRTAVFKLYPNLYQKGVVRASRIAPGDQTEGVKISSLVVAGKENADLKIDGTNMTVPLQQTLLPGKSMDFAVTYSYTLNKGSHTRTGQVDDGSYFIAYFFPRVAVYDDIDGWNMYPYRGSEEFYNDFCNFDAELSLPAGYGVWATGDLKNASEVFPKTINDRITRAETNDAVTDVITADDLAANTAVLPGAHTWKFSASNVTDFVFAASNHYIWKSSSLVVDPSSKRRTRVDAVFNPAHKDYFEIIDFARKTVEAMSYTFPKWPYPYQHETVFDGLDQMEYPMMVNDNPTKTREEAITLTDHEIFHTMFPFYMGINETKHGWMDEGWATIGEWILSKIIDPSLDDDYGIEPTAKSSGTPADQPIVTLTTDLKGASSFTDSYPKPAFGYLFVKDLLGDELFTRALHNYIRNWNGKHPIPTDFFYAMNEGSGKNLNWFWNKWFYEGGVTDQAIGPVTEKSGKLDVTVESKGKPMPVDLTVTYEDGTTEQIHRTIAVWEKGDASVVISFKAAKPVKTIKLGSLYVPDGNKANNEWVK